MDAFACNNNNEKRQSKNILEAAIGAKRVT